MRVPTAITRSCMLARRRTGRALEPYRFASPDLLEVVVGADSRLHDVHDEVAEVDQHPFAGLLAFDREHVAARRLDLVAHAGRQGPRLAVRGAGRDHHAIEQTGRSE